MKHFRCAMSWLCYGIGNVAFFLIEHTDDKDDAEPGWLWSRGFDCYQWGMCKSADLDTGDCGLWEANSVE